MLLLCGTSGTAVPYGEIDLLRIIAYIYTQIIAVTPHNTSYSVRWKDTMKPFSNQQFGALGEKYAADHLKQHGYKILKKNYKNKLGEIDLIAQDRDRGEIVFIEVKTRSADPYLSGKYAVDKRKQFHIMRTASYYLSASKCGSQPRFDIIEVEADRATGALKSVNHIENAFYQTEDYARF